MQSKFAYFTLVSHDWVIGAVAMIKSLRLQTDRPIEILGLPDLTNEDILKLEQLGARCTMVDRIGSKLAIVQPWHKIPDYSQNCFAKLHIWNSDYEKIIHLDSDIVVIKNIDHLFYLKEEFGAVGSTVTEINLKTKESFSFLSDEDFNSGVLLVTPNKKTYNELINEKDLLENEEGADQGLLNMHYKKNWYRLPHIYNATRRLLVALPDVWREIKKDICVIHYAGREKPWINKIPGCEEIDNLWWEYYQM